MNDCIFCKVVAGELSATKIYEDEDTLAFLDINPVNPGHTLVIPKEHYENFSATPNEWLSRAMPVIDKISGAMMEGLGVEGFNVALNNGRAAGQVVFHTHFHIIPRYPNDGHQLWRGRPYEEGEKEEVARKIKNNL